jgi:hypothetical protein
MTRFVLALAACVPCVALGADDPKMPEPKFPATELEGVWQEPLRPREDPAVRFKITFAGDKVTIHIGGQVLRGTFAADDTPSGISLSIRITITTVEGNGTFAEGAFSGIYRVDKGQLDLRINPELRLSRTSQNALAPAPVTLTLTKVKK